MKLSVTGFEALAESPHGYLEGARALIGPNPQNEAKTNKRKNNPTIHTLRMYPKKISTRKQSVMATIMHTVVRRSATALS